MGILLIGVLGETRTRKTLRSERSDFTICPQAHRVVNPVFGVLGGTRTLNPIKASPSQDDVYANSTTRTLYARKFGGV